MKADHFFGAKNGRYWTKMHTKIAKMVTFLASAFIIEFFEFSNEKLPFFDFSRFFYQIF
jgi:hypothetical protein